MRSRSTSLLPLLRSTVSRLACPDSHHLFSARGIPDNVCVMGAFRSFTREYLTPAHVCLLSRILFGYPCAPRTQPRRSRPNNIAIFSENGGIICIYAKNVVTLQAKEEEIRKIKKTQKK